MAIGLEVLASNIAGFLSTLAPVIAIILIILGGMLYGIAQTQPPDTRGKWQTAAISMIIGGIIVGAITAAAAGIESVSETLLKNG
jgi:uncharacterized membrane protein SirB2